MSYERSKKIVLVLLLVTISATFIAMLRQFLVTIVLAAIFAGLSYPLYTRLERVFGGRRHPAALCTLLLFILVIVAPTLTILGIVAREAFRVSQAVLPWVEGQLADTDALFENLRRVPYFEHARPYGQQILEKLGQVVASGGRFLVERLSDTTRGTVTFVFKFGIFLYTMFFFLLDGRALLRRVLYYLPLPDADERTMVDKFLSVSRATLKGTLVIGLLQGGLTGVAFAVVGLQGAIFWGTLAVALSIVPGVGAALIWVPGVLYLVAVEELGRAIFLLLFCGGVVSTLDNVLRPRLVGRDVQMHDLLILFGTLGGLVLFGVAGVIVGPILAALFVTVWEMYGIAFRDVLPDVSWLGGSSAATPAPAEARAAVTSSSQPAGQPPSPGRAVPTDASTSAATPGDERTEPGDG